MIPSEWCPTLAGVVAPVPRLALRREEAAAALGVSHDSFDRHIGFELRVVRRGALKLYAVTELQRWLTANAEATLEDEEFEKKTRAERARLGAIIETLDTDPTRFPGRPMAAPSVG